MGSFFTSLIPSLIIATMGDEIRSRSCPKVFILNGCSDRETFGMSLLDYVESLLEALHSSSEESRVSKNEYQQKMNQDVKLEDVDIDRCGLDDERIRKWRRWHYSNEILPYITHILHVDSMHFCQNKVDQGIDNHKLSVNQDECCFLSSVGIQIVSIPCHRDGAVARYQYHKERNHVVECKNVLKDDIASFSTLSRSLDEYQLLQEVDGASEVCPESDHLISQKLVSDLEDSPALLHAFQEISFHSSSILLAPLKRVGSNQSIGSCIEDCNGHIHDPQNVDSSTHNSDDNCDNSRDNQPSNVDIYDPHHLISTLSLIMLNKL